MAAPGDGSQAFQNRVPQRPLLGSALSRGTAHSLWGVHPRVTVAALSAWTRAVSLPAKEDMKRVVLLSVPDAVLMTRERL